MRQCPSLTILCYLQTNMVLRYALFWIQIWATLAQSIVTLNTEWHRGSSYQAWKGQTIINSKMRDYDRHRRPYPKIHENGTIAPVVVTTSLAIRSIGTVTEQNMEFKAQFRFQQEWFDERLRYDDKAFRELEFIDLASDTRHQIWLPDTFFQNEKEGRVHLVDRENSMIKLRADGKIIYNRRLSMTFSCVMNLLKYPMDVQTCLIDFASYAYTTDDIQYVWDTIPLDFRPGVATGLPNFIIMDKRNASCTSVTNTGTYSCLRVVIQLRRVFSFFLLQLYIPSSMLVAVSWVSYWIDWRATAGRVPLAIVTLLTMITQSHVINANLPPVSYTKAIDVWVGACVMFIFASLVEYAFVNYTGIMEQRRKSSSSSEQNWGFVESVWDMLMGKKRKEKRRIRSDRLFQNDSMLAAHIESSQERLALLRRRSGSGTDRIHYAQENMGTMGDPESLSWSRRRQAMPDSAGPYLSDMTVRFEDISSNLDWIRLRTRRRVELLQWCRIFKQRGRAERIDFVSRMLFPIAFVLFNIVYWTVYWT